MKNMKILECTTDQEISATFSVMSQLRTKVQADEYLTLIRNLEKSEGYRLVAVMNDNQCVAVAGYRIMHLLFADGKPVLYIDDLATNELHQGQGIGKFLFNFLKQKAKELNCVSVTLDSGMQRINAHHFYRKQGMQESLHFSLDVL